MHIKGNNNWNINPNKIWMTAFEYSMSFLLSVLSMFIIPNFSQTCKSCWDKCWDKLCCVSCCCECCQTSKGCHCTKMTWVFILRNFSMVVIPVGVSFAMAPKLLYIFHNTNFVFFLFHP